MSIELPESNYHPLDTSKLIPLSPPLSPLVTKSFIDWPNWYFKLFLVFWSFVIQLEIFFFLNDVLIYGSNTFAIIRMILLLCNNSIVLDDWFYILVYRFFNLAIQLMSFVQNKIEKQNEHFWHIIVLFPERRKCYLIS